jgi:hypothetical protein
MDTATPKKPARGTNRTVVTEVIENERGGPRWGRCTGRCTAMKRDRSDHVFVQFSGIEQTIGVVRITLCSQHRDYHFRLHSFWRGSFGSRLHILQQLLSVRGTSSH